MTKKLLLENRSRHLQIKFAFTFFCERMHGWLWMNRRCTGRLVYYCHVGCQEVKETYVIKNANTLMADAYEKQNEEGWITQFTTVIRWVLWGQKKRKGSIENKLSLYILSLQMGSRVPETKEKGALKTSFPCLFFLCRWVLGEGEKREESIENKFFLFIYVLQMGSRGQKTEKGHWKQASPCLIFSAGGL